VYPPKGGCEQSVPDGPTAAPTPECTNDSQCDDGDVCTVDTCDNGLCLSTPNCASCGKSKVDVEITIDNYGDETAYDIKDASGSVVMEGSGWPANSVNSFWKCVVGGTYTFKITDGYGDGICCNYGTGGYVVKANDAEVASGGQFGSSETKTFQVGDAAPTTPAPITPTPGPPTMFPTHTPPTMYPTGTAPTPYPTGAVPTAEPTSACGVKGTACTKHSDCCGGKCNMNKKKCRK